MPAGVATATPFFFAEAAVSAGWYTLRHASGAVLLAACNFDAAGKVICPAQQDTNMKPHSLEAIAGKDNPNIPALRPGDSVSVHVRIKEGAKERVQEFKGTVIRMRRGENNACFTVRRVASHSIGVERTFLMRSPRIEKVDLLRSAIVRRAKLYYLRTLTGKKARLKERRNK